MTWRTACFMGLLGTVAACGGTADLGPEEVEGTGGAPPQTGGSFSGGTGGVPIPGVGGAPGSGGEPYVDPDCPDEPPPPTLQECDPLSPEDDCGPDYGCLPYLEYPYGQGCGEPGFGSLCVPAGSASQGEFCDDQNCAPGFMCVVGAAGGKRCGQICEPVADHACPDGLVCGETDVQGYGVCF